MPDVPGMTSCPAGDGAHVDLGQAAVDVAAALEDARADERAKAAQRIVAHADKHAPKGDPATATLRRHLLIAARAAGWAVVGLMALVLAYWVVRLVRLLLHLRWAQRVSREAAQRRTTGEFAGWEPK